MVEDGCRKLFIIAVRPATKRPTDRCLSVDRGGLETTGLEGANASRAEPPPEIPTAGWNSSASAFTEINESRRLLLTQTDHRCRVCECPPSFSLRAIE